MGLHMLHHHLQKVSIYLHAGQHQAQRRIIPKRVALVQVSSAETGSRTVACCMMVVWEGRGRITLPLVPDLRNQISAVLQR